MQLRGANLAGDRATCYPLRAWAGPVELDEPQGPGFGVAVAGETCSTMGYALRIRRLVGEGTHLTVEADLLIPGIASHAMPPVRGDVVVVEEGGWDSLSVRVRHRGP